jgi:hypothetical protein
MNIFETNHCRSLGVFEILARKTVSAHRFSRSPPASAGLLHGVISWRLLWSPTSPKHVPHEAQQLEWGTLGRDARIFLAPSAAFPIGYTSPCGARSAVLSGEKPGLRHDSTYQTMRLRKFAETGE